MHRTITTVVLIFGSIALTGCESKQHMAARLQTEYAEAYKQYYTDCVAPANAGAAASLKGEKPETPSAQQLQKQREKCAAEGAKVDKIQQQLLEATAKQP